MKYGIIGASGKLGSEVVELFSENNHKLVFAYDLNGEWENDTPEVLINCSLPEVFKDSLNYAMKFQIPFIVASTGLSTRNIESLKEYSQRSPVVQSYNFSIGIQILLKLTELAKDNLTGWDVEITETHHRFKKDKPSGTARMIQKLFNGQDINISSLRLGNIAGDHTVTFGGLGETLTISHRALSRRTFADGILLSAKYIRTKENGFYTFTDVLFNEK